MTVKICRTIKEMKLLVNDAKTAGDVIGLIPTMGYFHEGHLNLMREARKDCDLVVVSLFVNPLQFGPGEDLAEYPRDFDRDTRLAEEVGVDVIFAPQPEEMYSPGHCTYVDVENITQCLCGLSRPGHFRGVATVVAKLFNIVEPAKAYFGQKDAQQVMVIEQMVRDLNMNLKVISVPIVREDDGLAMSSRNVYLNPEERKSATVLYRSLREAEEKINAGETDPVKLRQQIINRISSEALADIDYVELLSVPGLRPMEIVRGRVLIALAVRFGKTRLIDNTIVEVS